MLVFVWWRWFDWLDSDLLDLVALHCAGSEHGSAIETTRGGAWSWPTAARWERAASSGHDKRASASSLACQQLQVAGTGRQIGLVPVAPAIARAVCDAGRRRSALMVITMIVMIVMIAMIVIVCLAGRPAE